ncbi:hypothetical protein [Nocardia sp. NPDC046763]|uniref:hypothetical protein n=1 Tax=Nocardia sp. NPDC046763 TaxID=3155256 RepID=UPI003409E660
MAAALAFGWAEVGFAAPNGSVALTLYRVRAFPDEFVGRIFGVFKLITHGGTASGALVAGMAVSNDKLT